MCASDWPWDIECVASWQLMVRHNFGQKERYNISFILQKTTNNGAWQDVVCIVRVVRVVVLFVHVACVYTYVCCVCGPNLCISACLMFPRLFTVFVCFLYLRIRCSMSAAGNRAEESTPGCFSTSIYQDGDYLFPMALRSEW